MVSRVDQASHQVVSAVQNGQPPEHQVVPFLDDVDETDHSNSHSNSETSLQQVPSTPPGGNANNNGAVVFAPSPQKAFHSSTNSVESMVLLESDDESVEEQVIVDRRTQDLLLRRSSSRRLGEYLAADDSDNFDPESSSSYSSTGDGNWSDNESSNSTSSGGYEERSDPNGSAVEADLYNMAQAFLRSTTRLQALVRGYCKVKQYRRQLAATRRIQEWVKPIVQGRLTREGEISVSSAIRINALVRGFLARCAYDRLVTYVERNVAALVIQKWWTPLHRERAAAQRIQATYRGWATREFFALQRFAAILMQAQARGHLQRAAYQKVQRTKENRVATTTTAALPGLVPATEAVAKPKPTTSTKLRDDSYSSVQEDPTPYAKNEISIPALEDMGPASESNGASVSSSVDYDETSSIDVDSTQETVKTSNVDETIRHDEEMLLNRDILASSGEKFGKAAATATTPLRTNGLVQSANQGFVKSTPRSNTISKQLDFVTPPPPSTQPPPRESDFHPSTEYDRTLQYPPAKLGPQSSEDILPPSPAKTEVDDEEYDLSDSGDTAKSILYPMITVWLIVACFVLPVFFLSDKPTLLVQDMMQDMNITNTSLSSLAGPAMEKFFEVVSPPKASPQQIKSNKKADSTKRMDVVHNKAMKMEAKAPMTMETRKRSPSPKPSAFSPPANVENMQQRKPNNPPREPPKIEPVSIANIFMASADTFHGMQIDERPPVDSPRKQTVPLSSIFMPSVTTFHGTQIGEREKALSRSVSPKLHVPPLGQWAKSIRQRIFETSTVQQARIEVTGWLEMDGRGLFSHLLDPQTTAVALPKEPFMEEESIKIAKDAHLSLLAEWGLALSSVRKKK